MNQHQVKVLIAALTIVGTSPRAAVSDALPPITYCVDDSQSMPCWYINPNPIPCPADNCLEGCFGHEHYTPLDISNVQAGDLWDGASPFNARCYAIRACLTSDDPDDQFPCDTPGQWGTICEGDVGGPILDYVMKPHHIGNVPAVCPGE